MLILADGFPAGAQPSPTMPSSASRLRRRTVAAVTAAALAASTLLPPALPAALAQPLPDLGDVAQVNFTPVQERKLGEAIMRQARAQGGVLNDPEVNDYLNELGNRLVAASPDTRQDFEFFAVADNGINAFALPGGYIGVNTGLILLTQNESELAGVLAHEITHVTQRHIARMLQSQQSSMLMSLATLAVALLAARAGGSSSGDMASAGVATVAGAVDAEPAQLHPRVRVRGRPHRLPAPRRRRLRRARGGHLHGTPAEGATGSSETSAPSYLRTHPITYERIAEAASRAQSIPYRQVPDSLDYHMVRALLRSYLGEAQEAVRFFQDAIKERKYNSQVAAQYGLVASYLRARNGPAAKQALAVLEKDAPPHPMIDAMAAHVLLENGEVGAATLRIEPALQKYPNKMQLVYDYPEALIRGGRYEEAAKFCESQLLRFNGDGRLHRVAAQAYAGLQRPMRQHYHQGEYYAWLGNLRAAVDQLQLASQMGDGNVLRHVRDRDAAARAAARDRRAAEGRVRPPAGLTRFRTRVELLPRPDKKKMPPTAPRRRLPRTFSARSPSARSAAAGYRAAGASSPPTRRSPNYRVAKVERGTHHRHGLGLRHADGGDDRAGRLHDLRPDPRDPRRLQLRR